MISVFRARVRLRARLLEALALGEADTNALYDRAVARGAPRGEHPAIVHAELTMLEAWGLASSRRWADAEVPTDRVRRVFRLTERGLGELVRRRQDGELSCSR